jgi:hypothetical protein
MHIGHETENWVVCGGRRSVHCREICEGDRRDDRESVPLVTIVTRVSPYDGDGLSNTWI